MPAPSVKLVGRVVAAGIALTAIHFTDNVASLDTYPAPGWQPDWFGYVIGASWFAFTAIGVRAYTLYRAGRLARAHAALIVYSGAGFVSLGHFAFGPPADLTTRALITVILDAVVGSAVLTLAIRSIRARRVPVSIT